MASGFQQEANKVMQFGATRKQDTLHACHQAENVMVDAMLNKHSS